MHLAHRDPPVLLSPIPDNNQPPGGVEGHVITAVVVFLVGFLLLAGIFLFYANICRTFAACAVKFSGRNRDIESARTTSPPSILQPSPRYVAWFASLRSWFIRTPPTSASDTQLSQGTLEVDQDIGKTKHDEIASKRARRASTVSVDTLVETKNESMDMTEMLDVAPSVSRPS